MSEDKPRPTFHLIFLYINKTAKGKKSWVYYVIDPADNDGDPLQWDDDNEKHYTHSKPARVMAGAQPGSILEVEYSDEDGKEPGDSIFPSTAKLVGTWQCEEDVVKWRSIHRARQGEIERDQKVAKEMRRDLPAEMLEPFHTAYYACGNKRQQAQLLAWVIEQITRWPN